MILYPKAHFNNVKEISIEFLEKNNIKALILDVDNTLIDYDVRDYAEYIKEVFYHNKDFDCLNLVRESLNDKRYTRDDFGLFYARMLYPSYFFDCFSKYILEDKLKEEELMAILDRVDDYENLLKDIYYEIKKVYDIPEVTWLLKKSNKFI